MIDGTEVIEALMAYRKRLQQRGKATKAEAVLYCITIIRQLMK